MREQTYSADGTRQESTGWRDQRISERHRAWGFNCPGADIDFLMVEYNIGQPVGLIDYKHFKVPEPDLSHATYRALTLLADKYSDGPLPFLVASYWPDIWAFQVRPVNDTAKQHFGFRERLTERDFVARLYRLRRLVLSRYLDVEVKLSDVLPP